MQPNSPKKDAALPQPRQVEVLLGRNLDKGFDYLLLDGMAAPIGSYVEVPLGKKTALGVIWGKGNGEVPPEKCKTILQLFDDVPPMSQPMRAFIDWVSWYNCTPKGMVLKMALSAPRGISGPPKQRGKKEAPEDQPSEEHKPTLSNDQSACATTLREALGEGFSPLLLEGVTGSGKTEVYFEAIAEALKRGEQALVLLPEIALSVQWQMRFEKRFGEAACLWHSSVGAGQRARNWRNVATGNARIIVGARSALFLPFAKLGLIVVDEEHDGSYKQEDGVIYHARDMAVTRAHKENIPIVLASATPSLETLHNAQCGKYEHLHLKSRFGSASLPDIHSVDMRKAKLPAGQWLSEPLKQALIKAMEGKEQSLLFLNRRGYAPLTLCRTCGHRFACPSCTSWLVMHQKGKKARLECHHCGHREALPKTCPECANEDSLVACGPGVERLEEEVKNDFPHAKVAVITSDSTESAEQLEQHIQDTLAGEVDILIGTQMLAKGHHFPELTTVGVVDADMGLVGGDPRALERTYQLLSQIAGRAGREQLKGSVFLQTYQPESAVMQALVGYDGDALMQLEKGAREMAGIPPYGKLGALIVEGRFENAVQEVSRTLIRCAPKMEGVRILGPAPAPFYRLRGLYRYRLLVKTPKNLNIQHIITHWIQNVVVPASVKVKVDIDPHNFL